MSVCLRLSFLADLSCSYAIFGIKSRPLNITIQHKFLKIECQMSQLCKKSKH